MMTDDRTFPRISNVGLDGMLVTFASEMSDAANMAAIAFRAHVDSLAWSEVEESASTLVSTFLRIDLIENDPVLMTERLRVEVDRHDWMQMQLPEGRAVWTIPTVIGGELAPQFDEVVDKIGLDADTAKRDLLTTRMRVLTLGFAPGQPYVGHLPDPWNIARRSELQNVPAGALVTAVRQLVLFANPSPTGWMHVAQTAFQCFNADREEPVALRPGDEIQLTEATVAELNDIRARDTRGWGGAERQVIS